MSFPCAELAFASATLSSGVPKPAYLPLGLPEASPDQEAVALAVGRITLPEVAGRHST